jgi:hypothetical protein
VKEEMSIPHKMKQQNANWISYFLPKNCLLKHVIEGRIGRKRRTGRRYKQ